MLRKEAVSLLVATSRIFRQRSMAKLKNRKVQPYVFGLYYKTYRSIQGSCGLPTWFTDYVNNLCSSVIPLASRRYVANDGANDGGMLASLTHPRDLDEGCTVQVGDELCSSVHLPSAL